MSGPWWSLPAFTFAQLPMLGWLAAIVLPIAIHFLYRRRYREEPWAAMRFLLAAWRQRRRRMLLEEWLVLALRVLAVAAVVLAVAQPVWQTMGAPVGVGSPVHHVLVLDASYSMAYRADDKTRFERAKQGAADLVRRAAPGDAFTLVLMAAPPRVVVAHPAFDTADLLPEIERLSSVHTPADLAATLATVAELIDAVQREHLRPLRHEVVFFSDLDRVAWRPEAGSDAARAVRQRAADLARQATLSLVDVGQEAVDNAALTALTPPPGALLAGRPLEFRVQVKNSTAVAARRSVELLVNGPAVQRQQVEVPAAGEATLVFTHRFDAPGQQVIEARLDNDRLREDNHRYLVAAVREAVRVLCIDGKPSATAYGGAAGYLRVALHPTAGVEASSGMRVDVAPERAVIEAELTAYDCVFLCNVAQFTPAETAVLETYLAQGGSVVVFLGDRVQAAQYNAQLVDRGGGQAALLPARLGPLLQEPQQRIDPLDYRHPLLQAFRGHERAGLLATLVSTYYKLEVPAGAPARVVARLGSGDPLIVEQPVGRGRVVLVATSADVSWSKMPLLPSFLPLVQEMVAFCLSGAAELGNSVVGQPLEGTAPRGTTAIVIEHPDGHAETLRLAGAPQPPRWRSGATLLSGVYRVRFEPDAAGRSELRAANLDPAESGLRRVSHEQLRDEIWPGITFGHQVGAPPSGGSVGRGPTRTTAAVALLYVALALLLSETVVAWRLGRHQ